jgi:CRISPR-associated protein Cas2
MVHGARWWLVCYDIHDEKRLRKAAKHMEGYGTRLQYSVFRCWMSAREMERLRWELTTLLATEDDVLLIPLCSRCQEGIRTTHATTKRSDWPDEPKRFTIA